MLNEITIAKIKKNIEKGNSVGYICGSLGVGKSVVYKMLAMDPEQYDEYRQARKQKAVKRERPRTPCRSYKESLPPEQWDGARMLLTILKRLKGMNVEKPHIDLETLRVVWQKKMAERCC